MALHYINELPETPRALVVQSDSLSSLSAIQQSNKSSREDTIIEITVVIHQLMSKSTDVVLQWVPSHVSISGNEHADKTAKQAAEGVGATTKITLLFGYQK